MKLLFIRLRACKGVVLRMRLGATCRRRGNPKADFTVLMFRLLMAVLNNKQPYLLISNFGSSINNCAISDVHCSMQCLPYRDIPDIYRKDLFLDHLRVI